MTPICQAILEYLDKYADDGDEISLLVQCLAPVALGDKQLLRRAVVAACEAGYDTPIVEICAQHVDDVSDRATLRAITKALEK